jgi:Class II Aldolase and Adducin N-terminal domain
MGGLMAASTDAVPEVVAELIARSNRLGADRRNTNYAGGNTSCKGEVMDPVTASPVELLWVKGSGGDLGTLTEAGLAVLRLDRLRSLVSVYPGVEREDEMVTAFDFCLHGRGGAAPSIDTAMHGLVTAPHVDHLHPDAGIAFATAAGGEELTAYYHRGLAGEIHERLGAGMILGASLLTARGIPAAGEYELRTSLAMMIVDRLGGGGSFTELQALNFADGVVEMGHDGPAHLAISDQRPLLRGLGTYHGKRGWGVSVEFDVRHGPVTAFGIGQLRDGSFRFVASEGRVVGGPLLTIGNTTSRVDFGCDPGEWTDRWSATGIAHHWALGTGHLVAGLRATADLLGVEIAEIGL